MSSGKPSRKTVTMYKVNMRVRVLDYRQCSYSSCNLAFYIMLLHSVYYNCQSLLTFTNGRT